MQSFDQIQNPQEKRAFIDQEDRNGFIKKVYGILCAQLIITAEFTLLPYISEDVLNFMGNYPQIFVLCLIAVLVSQLVLICNRKLARTVPVNYYILGIFTICESYMVSFICTMYEPQVVFIAALMTACSVGGLTFYAWTTKEDFTVMRGVMSFVIAAIFSTLILCIFMQQQMDRTALSFLFVIIFGIYIVIDTQMIMGNNKYELSSEDYILGALILYLDIINLFLEILKILGKKKE
ncbi:UNKNOWN [Stylonychia lemnae]|uniref:Nmda receptor glutamate-binding chain n=1 Tax=Stylonychia lemnae TaxID=5949 RepID=A0A078AGN9_STYLE|nr:UNKNOWN [Stylonychia lemnae]|eukprot:CDW81450.1 UNKNOWN [Stylonychia lemnae]